MIFIIFYGSIRFLSLRREIKILNIWSKSAPRSLVFYTKSSCKAVPRISHSFDEYCNCSSLWYR
nr:MAG TPA: hypothetical protein [Caudoviricetes sp.]